MIIDNYTDIHSHLLFGLDDGPRGLDESIILLKMARDEGRQCAHQYLNAW